jgi:hypothetical protein
MADGAGAALGDPSATVPGRAHRLLCGDSRRAEDALRVMDGDKARWCWTDPPYGVEYEGGTADHLRIQNDGAKDLPELLRCSFAAADAVLTEGAPIYVAHPAGPLSLEFGRAFLGAGWHLHQTLVWVKDAMVLGHSDYHYQHEPLLYGWKGKNRSWYGGRDKVSTLAVLQILACTSGVSLVGRPRACSFGTALGALLLSWFVLGLKTGWSRGPGGPAKRCQARARPSHATRPRPCRPRQRCPAAEATPSNPDELPVFRLRSGIGATQGTSASCMLAPWSC